MLHLLFELLIKFKKSLIADDPLNLAPEQERFYNEAVNATGKLWKANFGEGDFLRGFFSLHLKFFGFSEFPASKPHQFYTHEESVGPFSQAKLEASFVRPPR
jgi:hypothetical protein